jgi:8-oxo-dGTP pyrophosphatase MutT (NUDIX family)
MKQKYKVFINDQEILFIDQKQTNPSCKLLEEVLNNVEDFYRKVIQNNKVGQLEIESLHPEQAFNKFIEKFKVIEAAGGLVRKGAGKGDILMIFRLGKWDLPKGKIEKNELPEDAAIREVEEECGIRELKILNKLENTYHIYELKGKPVIKKTHWYLMATDDNTKLLPQTEEGIEKALWVPLQNIQEILPNAFSSISSLLYNSLL